MTNFGDRIIVLIDMDCFFCQVETKLQPEHKGKPLAVVQYNQWRSGGIIAVNYEARDFGVTRHMRGDEAKEKCPDIVLAIVPCLRGKADTSRYRAAGRSVIEVLKSHCTKIERASVDEAYLDITQLVDEKLSHLTESQHFEENLKTTFVVGYSEIGVNDETQRINGMREWLQNSKEVNDIQAQKLAVAGLIVEEIRADIYAKTEFMCSAGISYNKILAKLACGLHKPNRQTILPAAAIPSLYATLPVKKVKNLGGKFGDIVMESLKCNVMADLLQYSLQYLQNRFDEKTGLWLFNIARGIDNEPVTTRLVSKSIGACKKFPGKQALTTANNLKHWLGELAAEVSERLEQDNEENERRATLLTLSYQYYQNNTMIAQSKSLPLNSYKPEKIQSQCFDVVHKIQQPISFLGLSATKFVKARGSENFKNFFRNDNSSKSVVSKSSVEDSQNDTVQEIKTENNVKENVTTQKEEINKTSEHFKSFFQKSDARKSVDQIAQFETKNEKEEKIEEPNNVDQDVKGGKIKSFFKVINNISSPEVQKTGKTKKEETKQLFFADFLKPSNSRNEKSEDSVIKSSAIEEQLETSRLNPPGEDTEKPEAVKLQDIFPDLNEIDSEVLSCLPLSLQKEAVLLKKKIAEKVSPKSGKFRNEKKKLEKQKKSIGKSIEQFFIKTDDTDGSFVKCEQCDQMICMEKLEEHKDYHMAQDLQKNINRMEMDDGMKNKRKNSSEYSPKKKWANDSSTDSLKEKSLTSFFT